MQKREAVQYTSRGELCVDLSAYATVQSVDDRFAELEDLSGMEF